LFVCNVNNLYIYIWLETSDSSICQYR